LLYLQNVVFDRAVDVTKLKNNKLLTLWHFQYHYRPLQWSRSINRPDVCVCLCVCLCVL